MIRNDRKSKERSGVTGESDCSLFLIPCTAMVLCDANSVVIIIYYNYIRALFTLLHEFAMWLKDVTEQKIGAAVQIFPGSSSSLYQRDVTVSVTASNTGGNATTNATLCE